MSSMIYRDALNALYSFGGIYAAGVLGWSIVQIGIFGILANLTGAIGAWLGGRADQKFGPKPVVSWSIVLLTLCCLIIISTTKTDVSLHERRGRGGRREQPAQHRLLHLRRASSARQGVRSRPPRARCWSIRSSRTR